MLMQIYTQQKFLLITINCIILFSLLHSYTPFDRNPIIILPDDELEMIQDSEEALQFVWHSLYGTPWYRIDTNGNLLNHIYFSSPDYSPRTSFFPLPETYDLIKLFDVGPLITRCFIK